jgi:SAM-dependent methyltransferase
MTDSYFDRYADSYDQDLQKALSVSGEDKNYFALGRMQWLEKFFQTRGVNADAVMDFGCGTGTATPFIKKCLRPQTIVGVDVSTESLKVATETFGDKSTSFRIIEQTSCGMFDVAFCNGVFHHIDPSERHASLAYVFKSLKPGGLFALFENNPWNPATRYVMSRCAFDADAITLSPTETCRRMREAGFEVISIRFLFIF